MIKIGTSGFSFDDWKGFVYPNNIKKQDMLSYYEKDLGFKILEVNSTYYALPSQKSMEYYGNDFMSLLFSESNFYNFCQ